MKKGFWGFAALGSMLAALLRGSAGESTEC